MIPSSGYPPWPPDHPRTLPRTSTPTPPRGARSALPTACLQQAALTIPRQQGLAQALLEAARDQAGAELAKHGEVKPGISQFQTERILPVDPTPDRIGCLPVRQTLGELQDRHQGQAPE